MHTLGTWLGALSMVVGTTDAPNGTDELIESTQTELAAAAQRAVVHDDVVLPSAHVGAALDAIHSLRAAYPLARGATPTTMSVTAQSVHRMQSMPMDAAVRAAVDDECDCLASSAPSRASLYLDIGPTLWLPDGDGSTVDVLVTFAGDEVPVTLTHGQSQSEVIDTLNASFSGLFIEARTADDAPRRVRILDPRCAFGYYHETRLEIEQLAQRQHALVMYEPGVSVGRTWAYRWDAPLLPADVDCDRTFGFRELVDVLGNWGDDSVGYDGESPIDAGDVAWIVEHWGPVVIPVIHVDASAPLGGDGRSWETAFRFLQDALHFVEQYPGRVEEIRLAGGTYRADQRDADPEGTGSTRETFNAVDARRLSGGWAGRQFPDPDVQDPATYETTLSGDLNGDDGPDFTNRDDNTSVLINLDPYWEGWTGFEEVCDLTIYGAEARGIQNGCATIRNVHFVGNRSEFGGAALTNGCQVIGCHFTDNHAEYGGAIRTSARGSLIAGCTFVDNSATLRGGAIEVTGNGSTRPNETWILDCIFVGNDAPRGAAIELSSASMANCTFVDNTGAAPVSIRDTDDQWDYPVVNSIIMSGAWPPFEIIDPGAGVISHCLLSEPWPGDAITVGDPLFVDAANGDYRLQPGSPAIDAGHSARRGAARWVDADGAPRMVDDPAIADRGEALGDLPVIDLGAYEKQ